MKAVIDTNILIDFLNGIHAARIELDLYDETSISLISWMEVLAGAQPQEEGTVSQRHPGAKARRKKILAREISARL